MAQDYYQILGISKSASAEEIKRAYRKLAHQYHPDKGAGSESKFKEVSEAYQVLSDPGKRQQYDRFGTTFNQNQARGQGAQQGGFNAQGFDFNDFAQGFGGFDFDDPMDIFSNIFGGGRRPRRERGVDLEMAMDLSFDEAVFGVEKEISLEKTDACEHCSGSGAEPGSKINTCPKCHGQGQIRVTRQTILGQMSSVSTCDRCDGNGKVAERACSVCKGSGQQRRTKTIKVKIPAGVENGQRIRISKEGEVGYKGSNFGDLYLQLRVATKSGFKREGAAVFSEIPISFYQAALGTILDVPTVDGKAQVKIPAGTQSGKVFRLKGRGAPILNGSGRGDHLLTVRVVTPTKLNKKEKELFKKLSEESGESAQVDESFWDKIVG
ncbi:MAG: molecular chaperone DnaJ [Candidatus Doudnabacteria bacterium RIFCSPLOWO2_02_FULL_49_13]|uniref:Chaperone protein DnaJ n=1 Tax=Candidatus Doudnabacteria bacterium RIFCSPHIGHO2_12_FULL_48_16 TaxID=1817838 RepID=A0A1F5PJW4_9BACT|nr:MAG: molecular chaperone DnaJ [Candidatus Doudnabacteria bacterium RIFCSPHIGHO2_02_FULL_49_24]OGE90216.1 MAG: molecular chaperone DnaJ [Candidatus Doudnabacteria bacterium RIFCSPHIGHO2_12_FULL_48_16]OGE96786.1 MAG: molecular chaperone DnaJ [Candidatus Doudnabacteria bacterium RIFCSPLOWO2_01_FULL_49_40]OGF02863.1 MAG: molecular chaperone DnaJ [Candidatus Doudnabacteria bacterium RIFCSPLOWO2_12_FULL_49_8]OGF03358.1 MAG: molecular chaperone DnaJ [Candidatus Doudnabacteria bacterium RIFCSPLOWO2_